MEKRIFAAVVLSIAFLWLWAAIAPRLFPELIKKPAAPPASPSGPTTPAAAPANATTPVAAATAPSVPAASVSPAPAATLQPAAAARVERTRVETRDFVATFSNRGAELVSFELKHYRLRDGKPVELVKARDPSRIDFPFAVETRDRALTSRLNTALYQLDHQVDPRGTHTLTYRYSDGRVQASKTFRIGNEYQFGYDIAITPPLPYRAVIGPGIRTLAPTEKDSQFIVTGNGVVQIGDELEIVAREKADSLQVYAAPQFIGIEDNYFLTVLKPSKGGEAILRRHETRIGKELRRDLYAGVNAGPDGVVAGEAFFGPKQTVVLESYGLESTLQFGWFGFIARMLLDTLLWINKYTQNFGWAIVVLTIIIKIVLYPLQHKSIVSMRKMQKVQPKVEAIRNKYKKARTDPEQRQKMNVEMMKLYQVEGINPMGGCLPILLQLPIFWGFYGLLSRAIELRGAPWILWVQDLSDKDPYYITPILMTATMFIQTAITPTTADPVQKKIFLAMPLVFGWIFKEFPSGLVVYWLVQNILTIVQQMIMNKWWKDHPDENGDRKKDEKKIDG